METCHAVTTTRVCLYGTFRGFYACSAGLYSSKLILDLPYSEKKGKYQGFLFFLIKYTPVTVALFFFPSLFLQWYFQEATAGQPSSEGGDSTGNTDNLEFMSNFLASTQLWQHFTYDFVPFPLYLLLGRGISMETASKDKSTRQIHFWMKSAIFSHSVTKTFFNIQW